MGVSRDTKRRIVDFLLMDGKFYGHLDLPEFLDHIWDLRSLPSNDNRYGNAYYDLWKHTVEFDDYSPREVLFDHLDIMSCEDTVFLKFLEECTHPLVVFDNQVIDTRVSTINDLLVHDGYMLKFDHRVQGDPVYKAVEIVGDDTTTRAVEIIERIARNFHKAVNVLCNRHKERTAFVIEDEYDVQDLFGAMLRSFFDDVRAEEVVPSYAGGHSRIDFLIKDENIIVELKKTRKNLKDKEIGNELLIDLSRYSSHPNCKTFMAFVYDPDRYIKNPVGLERDLSKPGQSSAEMRVKVIIAPH
ncbi:hypothetical protein [Dictyobacter kobayashii]|uniref:Uncharacterized protein n=1 Tax=Dictyobacter kobayashii TaxID=2014872 RepID=A0A402ADV5_9CHLR|nr:hypothetical protein [Dictyobacter kobayashii]GCE17278.1 hypothetical protein KDK_10780 [Dictyobacter kobayashii]